MMQRIDFIGPPGVGKTTLYNRLKNKRSKMWCSEWDIRSEVASNIAKERGSLHHLGVTLAKYIPIIRNRTSERYTRTLGRKALLEVPEEWEEFISYCYQTILESNCSIGRQSLILRKLIEVVEQVSFTNSYVSQDNLVLWDESLTHRVYSITQYTDDWQRCIQNYMALMPKPAGVIYVSSDIDLLLKRIKERGNKQVASDHIGLNVRKLTELNNKLIKIFDYSVLILKDYDVPVITINSNNPLEDKVAKGCSFLDNIALK